MKKGIFGRFFQFATEKPEEAEDQRSVEQATESPAAVEQDQPPEEDAVQIIEWKGALLEAWHKWKRNYSPPPISFLGGKRPEELPMGRQILELERVRLAAFLEDDAKRYLSNVEKAEQDPTFSADAACKVYLSKNKLMAWSFIFPAVGPNGTLRGESIGKALETSGVTTGIDPGAMTLIFQEPRYFKLVPIAIGTPAEQGINGSVKENYPRELAPEVKVDEYGVADYRALNYVQLIEKGAVICDITLPQPGKAGMQVTGKVIEPAPVTAAKIPAGKNTAVTEDGLQLIATRDGHLEFANGAFHVRALLEISGDVDYSTGNIDFLGDVHISGDVREGFVVRATGSITVDGLVEAATVEAGGDLTVSQGVVGDNKALLKSNRNVRVKYLENSTVYAGKGVYADCIMTSQIFSDGVIDVTSGRGSVIGGAMTAAVCIKARMIGAQSERQTKLTLGVLPYVQEELQNIQIDRNGIEVEQERLDKDIQHLESQGMEGTSPKLAKARMRRSVLKAKEQQLEKREERLSLMEADLSQCRLDCDVIYPVTSLTVGDARWTADTVRRNCKVVYDIAINQLKEIY